MQPAFVKTKNSSDLSQQNHCDQNQLGWVIIAQAQDDLRIHISEMVFIKQRLTIQIYPESSMFSFIIG